MKKLFKKSLAVIMIAVILLTAGPLMGFVGLDFANVYEVYATETDFRYHNNYIEIPGFGLVEDNTIEIEGYSGIGDVVIPSVIDGYAVTKIGEMSFLDEYITSVTIPSGVTEIGAYAFCNCRILTSVTIPNTVKTIKRQAFAGCSSLTNISTPSSVTEIDDSLFAGCSSLKKIIIFPNIHYIADSMFWGCTGLTKIIIPDTIKGIASLAFKDCFNIEYVHIPATTEIGERAFENAFQPNGYICSTTENCYAKRYADENGIEFRLCSGAHDTGGSSDNPTDNPNVDPDEPTTKPNQPENPADKSNTVKGRNFKNNIDAFLKAYNSSTYNPELANILAAFSAAAYNKQELIDAYKSFGFDNVEVYDYDGGFNPYTVGYALAFKKSEYSDETICFVTVRGTNNLSDVIADVSILTDDGKHVGFSKPADRIYENIQKQLEANNTTGDVKYVFTGHSLGAAVANLLSVKMMENGVSSSDVYGYTFATPNVAEKLVFPEIDNIFNLCNSADVVPYMPSYFDASPIIPDLHAWGKYGETYWFNEFGPGYVNPIANHNMEKLYLPYFDKQLPLSEMSDINIKATIDGVVTRVLCPVDVLIKDKNGDVLASVINGEIKYYGDCFGYIIIMTYDGHKLIYTEDGFEFDVELVGTDTGGMTYSVEKYNLQTGESSEKTTYSNVKLTKGKQMFSPVSDAESTSDVELFVVKEENGKKVITHTIDANGRETESYHRNIKEINIVKPSTETVNYGDTLILHADLGKTVLVDGYTVEWLVEGDGVSIAPSKNGLTCNVTSVKTGTVTVTARIVDKDGKVMADTDGKDISASQTLTSKAGLWQKIVSFFKNLFRIGRTIEQRIKSDR